MGLTVAEPRPALRRDTARGHIQLQDVAVGFGAASPPVLEGLTLDVQPGSFLCVLGPSGCGKSTVLNTVAGFVQPAAGLVTVDGEPITGPGADRGVVFQAPTLFPWLSVLDNVAFGPRMAGLGGPEAESTARTFLDIVGLTTVAKQHPGQLSGGMQQRVGIARALANYPRVLLMDEPFGALDAQTRLMMQTALLRIWQDFRTTVLFVTHDIEEGILLGDRVIVLGGRPGRIVDDIAIDLPRPRAAEMTFDPAFVALRRRCFELIRGETLRLFEQDAQSD